MTTYPNVNLHMAAGQVLLNDATLQMTMDELTAIRPSHGLTIPAGYIVAHYSANRSYVSDGQNQKPGAWPWPQAETILNDTAIAADLATWRAANPPSHNP